MRTSSAARRALAFAAAAALTGCGRTADRPVPDGRPNILLVTIDTLRADRLGRGVAPALDRLAESGLTFTAARSAVPLTLPSHATILTGLLPPAHGVRENGAGALAESHPTIARLLREQGYRTGAFVGAFVLDRRFGLATGFDTYDDHIPRDPNATERLEAERPAGAVVDAALAWLEHPAPGTDHPAPGTPHPAPFFVWLHLYDPHAPYKPPPGFSGYDGEISYADSQLARLFDRLRERGFGDNTVIVVAGDHGEGLGDHGERTHGMLLYDSTLRVPLVIAAPGSGRQRRDDPVSLADVAPTILRAAGVKPPVSMKGRDLLASRATGSGADIYAETEYPRVAGWNPLQALTDGRWKAIRAGAVVEIYDVQSDPGEQRNLVAAQPAMASAMSARIDALRAAGTPAASPVVSPEARERLRALGYVASSASTAVPADAPNPAATIEAWNRFEETLSTLDARPREALPALERLAARYPDAPVFRATYARALKDAGRTAEALAAYRKAAQRWPTDATLLHDLAVAAREAANEAGGKAAAVLQKEAIDADRAALALAPSSATARNGLGLLAVDQQRLQDAVREFSQAAELDPGNASYWANLGNARRATGDAAGAEQAYRRALDVDSRSADAANGLGVLLVEARRPGEAVMWFERVVTAAPDFVEARLNLGIALQQSGQMARAAEAYRAVLAARGADAREKEAARSLLAALGAAR